MAVTHCNDTFKFVFHLAVTVCTTERFVYEHVCQNQQLYLHSCNKKMEEKNTFLNLRGLSTGSFLAIWLSQYKFLIKEFLTKRKRVCENLLI